LGASRSASSSQRQSARSRGRGTADAAGAGKSEQATLVDATHYDFERLERAVALLTEQQEQLLADDEALREQLEDRERRIHRLESELDEAGGRRRKAMERMDSLITELDRLDVGLERSIQARGGGPPAEEDGSGRSAD